MKSGKKILIITPGFAKDEADTVCIPALQAYVKVLAARHEVVIYALDYPYQKATYPWFDARVTAAGGNNKKWRRLFNLRRLHQFIRQDGLPDLIHSFWWGPSAILGHSLGKRYGIPHLCTLMGQDVLPSNRYLRFSALRTSTLVAISPRQAEVFLSHSGRQPDAIIPFGIDVSLRLHSLPPGERDIDVLGVGSFTPLKNYTAFVEAVALCAKTFPQVRAVLIGTGEEQAKLENLVAQHKLQHNFSIINNLPNREVLEYMLRSKYLFHPSSYESLGFIFPEALSRGMEVISLPVGLAREGPRWHVCSDTAGMASVLLHRMQQPFTPEIVWTGGADETLSAYQKLYDTFWHPHS